MLHPQDGSDPSEPIHGDGFKARAREMGAAVLDRAQDRAHMIGDKAQGIARERYDGQRERIAGNIEDAAVTLRRHAARGEGLPRDAEVRVAHGMEATADYLHTHPSEEVARDLQGYVDRHPMRSLLLALLAGYLLFRLLR
jgi:ABC-type sugar transport system substrate-binding protein